jgi:cyclophilin family peptidyl-prolyl cis-trans isomerase
MLCIAWCIEIIRQWAPIGVDHFYMLLQNNYYNDNGFFRVLPGFVVQVCRQYTESRGR